MRLHHLLVLAFLLITLQGCAATHAERVGLIPLPEMKKQITAYHLSGDYDADVANVAADGLDTVLNDIESRQIPRPMVVMDIDETTLSNFEIKQKLDYCYSPKLWNEWIKQADAPAITPMLRLFRALREHDIPVVFLTGRNESMRSLTVQNLERAGYRDWHELLMAPAGTPVDAVNDFKKRSMDRLTSQGWTIVATFGDQPGDGYKESLNFFKLPNYMYSVP